MWKFWWLCCCTKAFSESTIFVQFSHAQDKSNQNLYDQCFIGLYEFSLSSSRCSLLFMEFGKSRKCTWLWGIVKVELMYINVPVFLPSQWSLSNHVVELLSVCQSVSKDISNVNVLDPHSLYIFTEQEKHSDELLSSKRCSFLYLDMYLHMYRY